jgi:acetylornithine/succinyldiaminopimelate/putrescine aminotransferase
MKSSAVFFEQHLAQTTPFPFALEIERAEGVWLFGPKGEKYMDLVSGVGVSNLGHGHPLIRKAIHEQVDRHLHVMVYGEYIQDAQKRAAEMLTSFLPDPLDTCYFVNSGTEANEAALKLARRATGRTKLVSCVGAYHGNTLGSMSVSYNEAKKAPFRPLLPEVYFMRFNAMEDLMLIDERTAGVIVETIQGDAGVRIPDVEYMQALRRRCDETGALLIFDEIQCGMGRSGTMWAFEQFGVVPDILTLGKALAGGMPVGCMVASRNHMELFTHDPMLGHISTFAGHPVICAAVAAALEVYRNENIVSPIEGRGRKAAEQLRRIAGVKEVRQRGYYFAIDMESADQVQKMVEHCLMRGVITFWFLSCPWSFRIAPPLTITEEEWDYALSVIRSGSE